MKYFIYSVILIFSFALLQAEETVLLSWSSKSAIDVKTKRKFEAKFRIKLGDMWKDEKPEILIKTLDVDECIIQISNIVSLKDLVNEVELEILALKDFKDYRLCLRSKNKIEYFRQTFAKREKDPEKEILTLDESMPNVVFFKKMEANPVGKSVSDCKLTGIVMNVGAMPAKMVRVNATILNALSEKIKEFDILLEQDKKPIILDGGDKFKIDRIEGGCKGFAGGKFGITWDGFKNKEVHVDSGVVGTDDSVFEFPKKEGEVSITKIVAKVINRSDLSLTVTIYNGLKKSMLNPVITIKLMNDKGELIQPITLEMEGELGSELTEPFTFEHKNAPPFSGIEQSIKYSTK